MIDNTPRTLNNNEVVSFSTADILVFLFKETAKDKKFTDEAAYTLAHLDSQIAAISNSIKEYMSPEQQQQLNIIKTQLGTAKDSPKRKELAQLISEMEGKLVNLNVQGEALLTESRHIVSQFWNTLVRISLADKPIPPETVTHIKKVLEDLNKKAKPFKEEEKNMLAKIKLISTEVEKMTGRPVEILSKASQELRK